MLPGSWISTVRSMCMGVSEFCTAKERKERYKSLWFCSMGVEAGLQPSNPASATTSKAYFLCGKERDLVRAAEAYIYAKSQLNAQAMFNLGYNHILTIQIRGSKKIHFKRLLSLSY
ncbi:BnaA02g16480D [Brassica napus]|uniref:(rape) hypothetical protein n=1 Tax=Brassica napus TaxID=3708 RepID=A0A078IC89_BRANA|nr:unnamed protein product [Brassica napus]CDY47747.1 BnaA02g16480D [Brassica napus]